MSVVHTFLDSIPGIFLGAPESDTVLGVLPGHRYLLQGNGMMALKLTLIGSFGALILSSVLFPVFLLIVKYGYPLVEGFIGYFLILIAVFMIWTDRKRGWALLVFLLSGCLGYIVLDFFVLKNPLFPMLSGLFGVATLLISLDRNEAVPRQKNLNRIDLDFRKGVKALFSGQLSGFLTAVFPGVGASMAAVISLQFSRDLGDHGFMVLLGSVNTVNFILSMATFYVLDKARNGSIIAVQKLLGSVDLSLILFFVATALVAGGLGVLIALKVGWWFSRLVNRFDYRKLAVSVIFLLVVLTFVLSGWIGFVVLVVSTAVGVIPAECRVKRTHAMGCLMLPVMVYLLNF